MVLKLKDIAKVVVSEIFPVGPAVGKVEVSFCVAERTRIRVFSHNKPGAILVGKSIKSDDVVIDLGNFISVRGLTLGRVNFVALPAVRQAGSSFNSYLFRCRKTFGK